MILRLQGDLRLPGLLTIIGVDKGLWAGSWDPAWRRPDQPCRPPAATATPLHQLHAGPRGNARLPAAHQHLCLDHGRPTDALPSRPGASGMAACSSRQQRWADGIPFPTSPAAPATSASTPATVQLQLHGTGDSSSPAASAGQAACRAAGVEPGAGTAGGPLAHLGDAGLWRLAGGGAPLPSPSWSPSAPPPCFPSPATPAAHTAGRA